MMWRQGQIEGEEGKEIVAADDEDFRPSISKSFHEGKIHVLQGKAPLLRHVYRVIKIMLSDVVDADLALPCRVL